MDNAATAVAIVLFMVAALLGAFLAGTTGNWWYGFAAVLFLAAVVAFLVHLTRGRPAVR